MRRPRRRQGSRKQSKHIVIAATDAEWETIKAHAASRGQSCARYLIDLVKRDAAERDVDRPVVLTAEEQRELLESVRAACARLTGGVADATPLVVDMQVRTAAAFMAYADVMAKKGHGRELHHRLADIVGEETARRILADAGTQKEERPSAVQVDTAPEPATLFDLLDEGDT